jgi:hypothetical protein
LIKDGTLFSRVVVILHCFWVPFRSTGPVLAHGATLCGKNRASYLPVGADLYITVTNVCIRT